MYLTINHIYYQYKCATYNANFCQLYQTVRRFPEMLHVLMSNRTNPLSHADARTLLTRLAHEFDENFDGKFSYAGQWSHRATLHRGTYASEHSSGLSVSPEMFICSSPNICTLTCYNQFVGVQLPATMDCQIVRQCVCE